MACPAPHCREALSSNEVTAALIILMDIIEGRGASGWEAGGAQAAEAQRPDAVKRHLDEHYGEEAAER